MMITAGDQFFKQTVLQIVTKSGRINNVLLVYPMFHPAQRPLDDIFLHEFNIGSMKKGVDVLIGILQCLGIDIHAQRFDQRTVFTAGEKIKQLSIWSAGQVHNGNLISLLGQGGRQPGKLVSQQTTSTANGSGGRSIETKGIYYFSKLTVTLTNILIYMLNHEKITGIPLRFMVTPFRIVTAHEIGIDLLENISPENIFIHVA